MPFSSEWRRATASGSNRRTEEDGAALAHPIAKNHRSELVRLEPVCGVSTVPFV